jgi:hypothetical protein
MPDLPIAEITHATMRRLRIKVPEKRRDNSFFDFVRSRLIAWDAIDRVETNPLTASILLYFSNAERLVSEAVAKNDFLDVDFTTITQPAEPGLTHETLRSFISTDHALRRWTHNQIDMRGAAFLLLFAGGVYQLMRGRLSTPAPTLLWYAGNLLGLWSDRPAAASTETLQGR